MRTEFDAYIESVDYNSKGVLRITWSDTTQIGVTKEDANKWSDMLGSKWIMKLDK